MAVSTQEVTPTVKGGASSGDALAVRLAGIAAPASAWPARAEALARLEAMGLPGARDEYWRFTDPKRFNAAKPEPIAVEEAAPDSPLFADIDRLRIVFVDGQFDAEASDDLSLAGVEIERLPQAEQDRTHWAAELYGQLEAAGQNPVSRPFAALNSYAAADGLVIRVTGKPDRPIHIIHRRARAEADCVWHHVVRVESGAEATILETGMVGARSNAVIEVDLAEAARLHYIAAKRAGHQKIGLSHIFARLAKEAQFKAFTLSVNGTLMRHEAVVEFAGDDAVAHVAGAAMGDGHMGPFHHDDTVFVTHDAERCESRQVFKKVLKNGAVGVFQGKILVKPGAQKTDGYQISQALLLDENSQFLGKPELEIYADDVQCSHGSTTGALDETAMFYLRSRGVPKARATVLLVLSFLADALGEIEDETLRGQISDRLEAWLMRRAGM